MQDQNSSIATDCVANANIPAMRKDGRLGKPAHNRNNLVGQSFGKLTVVELAEIQTFGIKTKKRRTLWRCLCDCGGWITVPSADLTTGQVKSCGCLRYKEGKDLTGRQFAKLTVLGRDPEREASSRGYFWLCKCECGKIASISRGNLIRQKSCGCLRIRPSGAAIQEWVYKNYQRSAADRGYTFTLSQEEFLQILCGPCHYCGVTAIRRLGAKANGDLWCNGIDRVVNTKGYEPGNVISACKICNFAKHSMGYQEFLEWVARVYKHIVAPKRTPRDPELLNASLF